MTTTTTYDSIPATVRAAHAALVAACEAAGLRVSGVLLHAPADSLDCGEDRVVKQLGGPTVTRYWPRCGGGALSVCAAETRRSVAEVEAEQAAGGAP